jgi:hypothetical protein
MAPTKTGARCHIGYVSMNREHTWGAVEKKEGNHVFKIKSFAY